MEAKMNRLAEILKGQIVNNTVVVNGRFDPVRAERIAERNGCTLAYKIVRTGWRCSGKQSYSPIEEFRTIFTF